MDFRHLGGTGLKVSELCLGTMTLGREVEERASFDILSRYAQAGGNFIDSANVYAGGKSEEIVGKWLAGRKRDDFVVATKVRFSAGSGPNDNGLSRKHILQAVHASLKRLGTDYIDLYQVHAWDPTTPLAETLATLNDLVRSGLVRYVGASNFRGWQLQKALDLSRQNGWEPFSSLQPQYSLLCRATEFELIPLCLSERLAVLPWSPLRGGWLSGKLSRGMAEPPEDTRIRIADKMGWSETWSRYNNDFTWKLIDELLLVARERGKSAAQSAIRWLLQKPGVTAPIVGARSLAQLEENLGASGWTLSDEEMRRLDAASEMPVSYPYDEAAERQQRAGRA